MGLTFDVWIRTRTSERDYFWVGSTPHEWWLDWGPSLLRRTPCLLRDTGERQRIFLSRIVSARRDGSSSSTQIRYDLAFEESHSEGGLSSGQVTGIIEQWWRQRSLSHSEVWPLAANLDHLITRRAEAAGLTLDNFLESADGVRSVDLVDIAESVPPAPTELEVATRWVGALESDAHRLIHTRAGVAYFTSATREYVDGESGLPTGVVVILDGESGTGRQPVRDQEEVKKAVPPSRGVERSRKQAQRSIVWMTLVCVALVAVIFTILALT